MVLDRLLAIRYLQTGSSLKACQSYQGRKIAAA